MEPLAIKDGGNVETPKFRPLDRFARGAVLGRLARVQKGRLRVEAMGKSWTFGQQADSAPDAHLKIINPDFYADLAFGGAIGAAESYMRGDWDSDDLTSLVRLMVLNRQVLEALDTGTARLTVPLRRLAHRYNRNSRKGSRRNIRAHYDLGNDFFRLWLDDSMMYSSAIYERDDMTLEEASTAKVERICRKLQLQPDDRVIEIGSGWGGFAIHAASNYGCHVTTTTISEEQYSEALSRVQAAGLADRVTVLQQDYRDLEGRYDKLVSIEMIEAVGSEYLPSFFKKCAALLKDDGVMCLQAITIADQRYAAAARSVDFIQRYIFPGGCLTSLTAMTDAMTRHTDLVTTHVEDFGTHYARTLAEWHRRFATQISEIRSLGYPEEFLRMWNYYLCYCEGAFLERAIGVVQIISGRPDARPPALVPQLSN